MPRMTAPPTEANPVLVRKALLENAPTPNVSFLKENGLRRLLLGPKILSVGGHVLFLQCILLGGQVTQSDLCF